MSMDNTATCFVTACFCRINYYLFGYINLHYIHIMTMVIHLPNMNSTILAHYTVLVYLGMKNELGIIGFFFVTLFIVEYSSMHISLY